MAAPLGLQNIPKEVQPSLTSPESQLQAAAADPDSIAAISMRTQVLAAQAIADSEYDPPVPPPRRNVSGFQNYGEQLLLLAILLILALLLLVSIGQRRSGAGGITYFFTHLMSSLKSRK